ncbi:MAG: GAF domain-containing protein [Deltaproteobacteria bacterium]|nr:GAF domain-containing protein [Deltaproteobacteria bacterium]
MHQGERLLFNDQIQDLIELVSNTTEAHTAALFLSPESGRPLELIAHQSLSPNIKTDIRIGSGEGLIGWVHKNRKPVNIDKFEHDTRRLLFYRTDEAIKSFMAVPLPELDGVLAVDSKQRYVFTEKNQKILFQFARILETALLQSREIVEGQRRRDAMQYLSDLETALYHRDVSGKHLEDALSLLRTYFKAAACFLAGMYPDDRSYYQLLAFDSDRDFPLTKEIYPTSQGLMGWILREKKPLNLERVRLNTEKSFIFYPDEPLGHFTSFTGLPLIWGRRLQGALCMAGIEPLKIDDITARVLEMSADRLAATLEMEVLVRQASDIGRLDSQTGLPHRFEFCRRVTRQLNSSIKDLTLICIKLELEPLIIKTGQEMADKVLKKAARELIAQTEEDTELGHLTYGVFGLAVPDRTESETVSINRNLVECLQQLDIGPAGRVPHLGIRTFTGTYPSTARRAEDLINQGLLSFQPPTPQSL